MSRVEIPRLDQKPPGAEPRSVRIRGPAATLRRRGFLAVVGAGAVALSVTLLGWIPLARPARAEEGSEYPECGMYGDGEPGGPICVGGPYSAQYCGDDGWFRTGCEDGPDGEICYQPVRACRAAGEDESARNAWRWQRDGVEYRCADGRIQHEGAPNSEFVICSARLTEAPGLSGSGASDDAGSPEPQPEPEPTERGIPGSLLPELPSLPRLSG